MDLVASGFKGTAKRMQPSDLVAVAKAGGYETPSLQAILDVESAGSGFDDSGRPKTLPEPAVFFTQLWDGKKVAADWQARQKRQLAAIQSGLATAAWGSIPYPATSDARYSRLARMMAIDPSAALRSCSWGIGQVMGFNYAACGYPDVETMVSDACASEVLQFGFVIRFIEHAGLGAALKRRDWAALARGYNGPGNVEVYSKKLATAYAVRSKTGTPAPAAKQSVVSAPIAEEVPDTEDLNNMSLAQARFQA